MNTTSSLSRSISSTATSISSSISTSSTPPPKLNLTDSSAGKAQASEGVSLESFLASMAVAAAVFGVEVVVFVVLRKRLQRVYEPRTYLVPEKRRTKSPASGLLDWFKPVFATANSEFISKSGLDAYFFLRYLLMLLKIFCILAVVILPVLLPLNSIGGRGEPVVRGMDKLSWTNVAADDTTRYWAHLLLAIVVVVTCCYMFYNELRAYVRLRQAYLTSPQHRLRASATTVLVNTIPRKWLSVKALIELYDVFPGGIRNIWINRDYEELAEKVEERDKLARLLEAAETELITKAKKKHMKVMRKATKCSPLDTETARAVEAAAAASNEEYANGPGVSSGNPHQIPEDIRDESPDEARRAHRSRFAVNPIPMVGQGFNKLQHGVIDGMKSMTGGVRRIRDDVGDFLPNAEAAGFQQDDCKDVSSPGGHRREPSQYENFEKTRPRRGSTLSNSPVTRDRRASSIPDRAGPLSPINTTAAPEISSNPTNPVGGQAAEIDAPSFWMRWKRSKVSDDHKRGDEDETPLSDKSPISPGTVDLEKPAGKNPKKEYPKAFNEEYADDKHGEPVWKKYLTEKDRATHRLPIHKWLPSFPLIGRKVDTIIYCRKELARLNIEIEEDQSEPEKYPLMNSAFIQFNHQVAAHMACQSLSHHVPQQMCPRQIEVSPDDVIWGNMKIKWWERYVRKGGIAVAIGGLIIGWFFPVAFVGLVSQIDYLTTVVPWLAWLNGLPNWLLGLISGVLPPVGLAILMALLPIILRTFARIQGMHTGMAIERSVQGMYFAFLFIQVFLVVSISSGITTIIPEIAKDLTSVPTILAKNLPKAANFFFSYLLLQAFTVSGGALVQIGTLLVYFVISPLVDNTAREKFVRATSLTEMQWGTFFPVYTNLACIGIIYSIISPLILIFNVCTFSLFWLVYRYNLLFVNNHRFDTGGLLFPRAINQLFTGIYVMEICLIGLFFLVRDVQGRVACLPQAVIMAIITGFTVIYQYLLNGSFAPLLTYLPITLEDNAVIRDGEFAKENDERKRLRLVEEEEEGDDINEVLARKEREEAKQQAPPTSDQIELKEMAVAASKDRPTRKFQVRIPNIHRGRSDTERPALSAITTNHDDDNINDKRPDIESQPTFASTRSKRQSRAEDALFANIADEIEDLSPEERDRLVARAFQHEALRAKRPVIWIPRDDLGISDDEVRRTQMMSCGNIWISNEYAGLDSKARVVYRRSPPDFDMRDLVEL